MSHVSWQRGVTFCLSPHYGIHNAREAHAWFLSLMRTREEFEVEMDEPSEWPVPFCSETVRQVMVESLSACAPPSRSVASACSYLAAFPAQQSFPTRPAAIAPSITLEGVSQWLRD